MEMGSFNVGRYIISPKRKILGFSVLAKPDIGVLEKIGRIARETNSLILYLSFSSIVDDKNFIKGIGFVDVTDARVSVSEIVSKLKNIKNILDVKIIHPMAEGFIGDIIHHKLYAGNERIIFLNSSGFRILVTQLSSYGSGGLAILYNIGYEIGKGYALSYKKILERLGIEKSKDVQKMVAEYSLVLNGIGRGEIKEIKFNPFTIIIRLYDNFECSLANKTEYKGSNFVRGIIAGIVEEFCGKKVMVQETKCIAKGDPYCEFYVFERS